MAGQGLFDALSGAAGHPIDRPGMNAYVANSQALNGLRSAQTEEALLNAQKAREEQDAGGQLEGALGQVFGPGNESKAHAAATIMRGHFGDAKTAMTALNELQQNQFHATMGDPGQLNTPAQTAASQGISGKLQETLPVHPEYTVPAGVTPPQIQQTPLGAAQTAAAGANANLHQTQADAGGFNPHTAAGRALAGLSPDDAGLLQKAVADGRLDPTRINSRTAPILAQMERASPGTVNYNRLHADAVLQSNAGFQQKAMSVDMLPGLLQNVTALGKKVGYNDVRTVGKMQSFLKGETNDPDYTEYMTARNDTLLRLAGVMRGVGMSDQAHTAEVEAMAPTLAPYALDAWLKGQMSVVTPLLERQNKITHLGEPGAGTSRLDAPASAAAPSAPPSLGSTVPTVGGGPAAPSGGLASYPSEAAALAAGHKIGDRVMIGGVSGTLR
jgi:hypothetical protein